MIAELDPLLFTYTAAAPIEVEKLTLSTALQTCTVTGFRTIRGGDPYSALAAN